MDRPNEYFPKSSTGANIDDDRYHEYTSPTKISFPASGVQSSYAQHPAIDFDGLSWPGRYTAAVKLVERLCSVALSIPIRMELQHQPPIERTTSSGVAVCSTSRTI